MAGVVALTTSLGLWQVRRADEKAGLQARAEQARAAGPLDLGAGPLPAGLEGRAVRLRGRYVPAGTIYIDNRTHRGVAGFHVLTPVRIDAAAQHVMVLRGWVPRDPRERMRLPAVPTPEGEVEITGLVEARLGRTLELRESAPPGPGERLWQNYDPERFRAWSGLPVLDAVVRQDPGGVDDGLVREWRMAGNDVDKHRGYAFQWFAMAAAALAVTLYLMVALIRHASSNPR
jgi:surfeit locus 1 family protein